MTAVDIADVGPRADEPYQIALLTLSQYATPYFNCSSFLSKLFGEGAESSFHTTYDVDILKFEYRLSEADDHPPACSTKLRDIPRAYRTV